MTDRLDEIKAGVEKATPGPWSADDEHGDIPGAERAWCVSKITESGDYSHDIAYLSTDCADPIGTQETADAEFIAHAREDIPWLIAEVELLRAENLRLTQQRQRSHYEIASIPPRSVPLNLHEVARARLAAARTVAEAEEA